MSSRRSPRRRWGAAEWTIVGAIATVIALIFTVLTFAGLGAASDDASSSGAANSTLPSDQSPAASPQSPAAGTQTPTAAASPSPSAPESQYSPVSLADLCASNNIQSNFYDCSRDQPVTRIGQTVYNFSSDVFTSDDGSTQAALSVPADTCRSVSLRFSINPQDLPPSNLRIRVSVVQSGSSSAIVTPNQLQTLSVSLGSGPWEIDTADNLPDGWNVLMDGSASCSIGTGS